MVSTPEVCTENSPISPSPYVPVKTIGASKSLRQFLEALDFKKKSDHACDEDRRRDMPSRLR